ncbi:hypothetical protein M405DRAFT_930787 [Rhizopogon salebrosus TDB-379]|nr:hypothetical protein M405DRAFT_930787 [Rhizopogon salebrosus TDB-379]
MSVSQIVIFSVPEVHISVANPDFQYHKRLSYSSDIDCGPKIQNPEMKIKDIEAENKEFKCSLSHLERKIKNIEVKNKEFKRERDNIGRKIKVIEADNKELKSENKKVFEHLHSFVHCSFSFLTSSEVRKLKEQCMKLSKDSAKNTTAIAAIHRRIILDDAKAKLIKRYPGVSEEPLNPNHYGAQSSRLRVARMKRHSMVVDTSSTSVRGRGNTFAHETTLEERADAVGNLLSSQESKAPVTRIADYNKTDISCDILVFVKSHLFIDDTAAPVPPITR